jgi:hypothetical protein
MPKRLTTRYLTELKKRDTDSVAPDRELKQPAGYRYEDGDLVVVVVIPKESNFFFFRHYGSTLRMAGSWVT